MTFSSYQCRRGLSTDSKSSSTAAYIRLLQRTFKSCACQSQPLPVADTCAQLLVVIYKNCHFRASQFCCKCSQTLEQFTTPTLILDTDIILLPRRLWSCRQCDAQHSVTAYSRWLLPVPGTPCRHLSGQFAPCRCSAENSREHCFRRHFLTDARHFDSLTLVTLLTL